MIINFSLRNKSLKNMTELKLSSLYSQLTLHLLIKVNQADHKNIISARHAETANTLLKLIILKVFDLTISRRK